MEYLYSALHSLAAALFLCSSVYRMASMGAVTYFEVLFGIFALYVIFHNNNDSKRYLCLKKMDLNTGFFHWVFKAFTSIDFWISALSVVLPVSLIVQLGLNIPFYFTVLITLPVLLLCEAQQCRRWTEVFCDYCELRNNPDVKEFIQGTKARPFKKIVNMVLGCMAVALVRTLLYLFTLASPVVVFVVYQTGSVIAYILCIIPLLLLLRGYDCMRKRKATVKALAEICKQYGYTIEDNTRLLKGLYYSTGKTDVILVKGNQRYAISFLPVPYKTSSIIFYTDKKYNFRPRILGINLSFPSHSIGFGDEEGEKYLLFTKAAARARFFSGRNYMEIDNGEVLYGAKLYSVTAFLTYFDRLARKEYR